MLVVGRLFLDEVAVLESGDEGHNFAGEDVGEEDENAHNRNDDEGEIAIRNAFDFVLLERFKGNLLSAVNETIVFMLVRRRGGVSGIFIGPSRHADAHLGNYAEINIFACRESFFEDLFIHLVRDILFLSGLGDNVRTK